MHHPHHLSYIICCMSGIVYTYSLPSLYKATYISFIICCAALWDSGIKHINRIHPNVHAPRVSLASSTCPLPRSTFSLASSTCLVPTFTEVTEEQLQSFARHLISISSPRLKTPVSRSQRWGPHKPRWLPRWTSISLNCGSSKTDHPNWDANGSVGPEPPRLSLNEGAQGKQSHLCTCRGSWFTRTRASPPLSMVGQAEPNTMIRKKIQSPLYLRRILDHPDSWTRLALAAHRRQSSRVGKVR